MRAERESKLRPKRERRYEVPFCATHHFVSAKQSATLPPTPQFSGQSLARCKSAISLCKQRRFGMKCCEKVFTHDGLRAPNAAVQRPRDHVSSDWVSRSAATACSATARHIIDSSGSQTIAGQSARETEPNDWTRSCTHYANSDGGGTARHRGHCGVSRRVKPK